jgi:hypothetical protein
VIEQLIIILDSDVTEIRKLDPIKWDEYFDEKALLRNEIKIRTTPPFLSQKALMYPSTYQNK